MPSLPTSVSFTDSAVTEAQFKTAITNQREFLASLLGTTGTIPTAITTLGNLGSTTISKTTAYTVALTDRGAIIECTGTFTLSLTLAATLGQGFVFAVFNKGTGVITIDPASTELINGASTLAIAAGSWAIVSCTGTAFNSLGSVPSTGSLIGYQIFTASGTYTKATNNPSFVIVEVVGGGGSGQAGSFSSPNTVTGAGGGGGGYSRKTILNASLSASETVTVGGATQTSSFGVHASATGGVTGGAGGTGASGDLNISGSGGGPIATNVRAGFGGGSFYAGSRKPESSPAQNGNLYGGGGAGGVGGSGGLGTGASGIVIVWEYK